MTRAAQRSAAVAMALGLVAAACGSDGSAGPTEPTVADARFDGSFEVASMIVQGEEQELLGPITFEVDTEFGGLGVETPCGTLLGSFSLLDDGRAGVTIAGGSRRSCSAEQEAQQLELVALLDRVSEWTETDSGFELRSAQDDALTLVG